MIPSVSVVRFESTVMNSFDLIISEIGIGKRISTKSYEIKTKPGFDRNCPLPQRATSLPPSHIAAATYVQGSRVGISNAPKIVFVKSQFDYCVDFQPNSNGGYSAFTAINMNTCIIDLPHYIYNLDHYNDID